jgi:hypothetical protein
VLDDVLEHDRLTGAKHQLGLGPQPFGQLARHQLALGPAEDVLDGAPHLPRGLAADERVAAVAVGRQDQQRRVLDDRLQDQLRRLQRRLGPPLRRQVGRDPAVCEQRAVVSLDRELERAKHVHAVVLRQRLLVRDDPARRQQLAVRDTKPLVYVSREQIRVALADHGRAGEPGHAHVSLVDEGEHPRGVTQIDHRVDVVDRRLQQPRQALLLGLELRHRPAQTCVLRA